MIVFIVLTAGASPLITGLIGAFLAGLVTNWDPLFQFRLVLWWSRDFLGILNFAPLILAWQGTDIEREFRARVRNRHEILRFIELIVIMTLIVVVTWISLSESVIKPVKVDEYLVLPFLVILAYRFRLLEVVVGNLIFSLVVMTMTLSGSGDFYLLSASPVEVVFSMQAYLGIIQFTTLLLSVVISQLRRTLTGIQEKENEVRVGKQNLEQVINLIPHFIYVKDDQGRFLIVNQRQAATQGMSPDQMYGRLTSSLAVRADEDETYLKDDRWVIEHNQPLYIPKEYVTVKGKEPLILQTTKVPFTLSGYNRPAILGISIDITEQVKAESALRESEQRFRTLVDTLPHGVVEVDLEAVVTFVNPCDVKIMGVHPGRIFGPQRGGVF